VFCEVSANSDDWLKESQWVQSLADGPFKDSKPRIGAIMAQPPPGFGTSPVSNYSAQLDELQAKVPLVRGVRTDLAEHTPDKLAALKELGRRNLVVDFLSDIVSGIPFQIIRDTPTVKYQIEHLGCGCGVAALYANQTMYKQWQAAIKQLATLPNIQALQVGGTMAGFKSKDKVDAATIKPFVQTVVREFGFKRLVPAPSQIYVNRQDVENQSDWNPH
jgi:predicted TIM-barrel fold metal-dependent hydrolase